MPITGCNHAGEDVLMERCLLFFELSTDYENHLCQGGKIMPEEIVSNGNMTNGKIIAISKDREVVQGGCFKNKEQELKLYLER